jgi:hypothetical protein
MNASRRAGRQLAMAAVGWGALAIAFAATAGATHRLPRQEDTTSGTAQARAALLRGSDLGRGWFSDPPPNPLHIIAPCRGRLDPRESDLIEVGAASAFFNHGPNVLMQTTSVYITEFDARAAWSRTLAASPLDCMRTTLAHNRISPERSEALPSLKGVTAYRVVASFKGHRRRVVVYFDQLLVHRGRVATRVFLTSYTHPFSRAFETRLARTLLRHLAARAASVAPIA